MVSWWKTENKTSREPRDYFGLLLRAVLAHNPIFDFFWHLTPRKLNICMLFRGRGGHLRIAVNFIKICPSTLILHACPAFL